MKNGGMNVAVRDLQTLFGVGALGGLTDGQLLDRFVAEREGTILEAIVHRHGPTVWGVCRRVLHDHHDAEDAFQATFLVLARKAASLRDREKLGNWLYGVAYQTAMKARALRAKRRVREGQVPDMPEPMAASDDLRDDLTECLDRELSRLPEKYRIPVVLCDLDGQTRSEAASQLGWRVGTVSSRLSRARALLARRLSRPGMTLSGGSLAVLLAQESASASVPTRLIGSTAQAASLYAAGGAATAGVVSAGVVALTGEMMKMMMLSKIKVATLLLLLALTCTGMLWNGSRAVEAGQESANTKTTIEAKEEPREAIGGQKSGPPTELEGTWVAVSVERKGKTQTVEEVEAGASLKITFRGDRYEEREEKIALGSHQTQRVVGSFIVSANDRHKTITMIPMDGKRDQIDLALYEMRDGTLRMCNSDYNRDRPKSFNTTDNGQIVTTFKREKTPQGGAGGVEAVPDPLRR